MLKPLLLFAILALAVLCFAEHVPKEDGGNATCFEQILPYQADQLENSQENQERAFFDVLPAECVAIEYRSISKHFRENQKTVSPRSFGVSFSYLTERMIIPLNKRLAPSRLLC